MIEVVFSESAAGSLKCARTFVRKEDIYCFHLCLSMGLIEDILGAQRQEVLAKLFGCFPDEQGESIASQMIVSAKRNLEAIKKRLADGEILRIWTSKNPDEWCGLHWFLNQLKEIALSEEQLQLIQLPEWEMTLEGNIVMKRSFGEVAPKEWAGYMTYQQTIPAALRICLSNAWETLKRESFPLRVIVNGQLIGVREDFYDEFIKEEIQKKQKTFLEAKVIGRLIGDKQLGISDAWIAIRIQKMVEEGWLEIVQIAKKGYPTYHRLLKIKK